LTDRLQRQNDCKYTVVGTEGRGKLQSVRSYRQMEIKNENLHVKKDERRET